MNRGRRGDPIFADRRDYERFIEILKETAETWNLRITAFCLLPNHYHLLVQTPDGNLSRCMRHIDGVYTQRFNRVHHCDGPLFRGRYKAILLDAESYLLQLVRYIHRNPLTAGLTERFESYDWSSHRGYISTAKKWNWLHKNDVLSMLSEREADRQKRYRQFVAIDDAEELSRIYQGTKWPSILGTERFVTIIKDRFFSRKLDDEVPQSRELAPDHVRIKKVVCEFYGINEDELLRSRRGVFNEPRNMAIYLTRRLTGESLSLVGLQFQVNKYSSVSSVIERMKALIFTDRRLKERAEKLLEQTKSQEQT